MKKLIRHVASLVSASAAGVSGVACAAIPDMSPARLQEVASHIFTGRVARIYSTVDRGTAPWETTHSVAEIKIDRVEKGKHESRLAYVRFWTKKFTGSTAPPPGDYGHRGLPKAGAAVRVFVVPGEDAGFDVLPPNGFTTLGAAEAQK